ncbi:hypothetical protein PRIPAC_77105 [Pristionchus pacificus]|uniref:Uncharacterized protein n=1 Tax=Pristionchus pacificus TaxID=54126 RepID=A0A2A6BEH1_PRIPA|nr:hypothetical protein PRIPAC_77105 [Pristionchus pacificus]|eukprot:PDM64274.1 hypothetical protein PRIPAC_53649 [Pristionchus pacificus]
MESPEPKKPRMEETAMDTTEASTSTSSFSPLSPIETLPKELFWKVLARTPEIASAVRGASKSLRQSVDNFALSQSTMPLVDKLSFSGKVEALPGSMFSVDLDVDEPSSTEAMKQLCEWTGRRIGEVQFFSVYQPAVQAAITDFLKDKQATKLAVMMDELKETLAVWTLNTAIHNNVKHVRMYGRFETTIDTMLLLRQLAAHVNGIHIYQTPLSNNTDVSTAKNCFGLTNTDWAEVILELMANPNPLSKVCIVNNWMPEYLSASATDRLLDELPRLDKQIWFMATCKQYEAGYNTEAHKNFLVKINAAPRGGQQGGGQQPQRHKQFLEVKHVTRVNEPAMLAMDVHIDK